MNIRFAIYDVITDEYLCEDTTWDSWNVDGLSPKKPKAFRSQESAAKYVKTLEKDFLSADPSCVLHFEVVRFESVPYYRFL